MLHSYELLARYVMPQFQGSIKSIKRSNEWVTSRQEPLVAGRVAAIDRAHETYTERNR
jgi:limonene 1,2-monooxygenase